MSTTSSPLHRKGTPGGPGCRVNILPVQGQPAQGNPVAYALLDAGHAASEIELLRTIAKGLGVRWGYDEAGWWAAVPERPASAFAAALYKAANDPAAATRPHALYTEDGKGSRSLVGRFDDRAAAEAHAKELLAAGKKQYYYIEPVLEPLDRG